MEKDSRNGYREEDRGLERVRYGREVYDWEKGNMTRRCKEKRMVKPCTSAETNIFGMHCKLLHLFG